jgi:hypothetical protein
MATPKIASKCAHEYRTETWRDGPAETDALTVRQCRHCRLLEPPSKRGLLLACLVGIVSLILSLWLNPAGR